MSEISLDCTLSIKANRQTLDELEKLMTGAHSDRPPLSENLATIVQQVLIAAGIEGDFDVKLQRSHIAQQQRGGGLNANEWLEASGVSKRSSDN